MLASNIYLLEALKGQIASLKHVLVQLRIHSDSGAITYHNIIVRCF